MHARTDARGDGAETAHHAVLVGIHHVESGREVGAEQHRRQQAGPVTPPHFSGQCRRAAVIFARAHCSVLP